VLPPIDAEAEGNAVKITSPIVTLLAGVALTAAFVIADLSVAGFHKSDSDTAAGAAASKPSASTPDADAKPSASATKPADKPSVKPSDEAAAERPTPPRGELIAVPGTSKLKGNARDWAASATMTSKATVSGRDTGVRASWQLLWDRSALYLRATVHDPQIVQPFENNPGQLFRGDSVSLELGEDAGKLSDGSRLRSGDGHYLFGPLPDGGLVTAVNHVRDGSFVNGKADPRIRAVERKVDSGYQMEIAIPWSVVGVDPASGLVLAANLNVSDGSGNGDLRAMKSTNPRRNSSNQSHPGTWQKLELQG
jgi:Carbohydrate family 9 binding domain-like